MMAVAARSHPRLRSRNFRRTLPPQYIVRGVVSIRPGCHHGQGAVMGYRGNDPTPAAAQRRAPLLALRCDEHMRLLRAAHASA